MDARLLTIIRDRVATRYYDRPEIIDVVARIIHAAPPPLVAADASIN